MNEIEFQYAINPDQTFRDLLKEYDSQNVRLAQLRVVKDKLSSAESMIDGVIDGKVKLGKKAIMFFEEYRHRYPKTEDK